MSKPRKAAETILLRIAKGALVPDDDLAVERLRARGFRMGDVVTATLRKPRNPKFHRLAHALGQMLVENIEAFENLTAHDVLKRLQIESGVGCDAIAIHVPGVGMCEHRQAKSLSFENLDQAEFEDIYTRLCRHVRARYWPQLPDGEVERMTDLMSRAA